MLRCMRTTLTLDDDVARLLEEARRQTGASLKDVVNDALRTALQQRTASRTARKRYATKSVSLGNPLVPDLDDVAELLAAVEGERYR